MKITSGKITVYQVPTGQQPHESDGTATWDHTGVVVVELSAGGKSGIGFSYTDPAASAIAKDLVSKDVIGKSAFDIPHIHSALDIRTRNTGRPGLVSTAISAIDICLWDLKAKLLGVSTIQLLGQMRTSIAAYGSGGFTSYSEAQLIQQMTCWAAEGLRSVKMKIGRHPEQDVPRAAAVVKALAGRAQLYVDANGAYTRKQALYKAEQFGDLGVVWFEEPVSSDDRLGLHLLVERAPAVMDIAAGEYSYTLDDARLLIEAQAVDVMQADVTRCGGVTNFLKIADVCESYHLPLSAHTSPSIHATLCCAAVPAVNVEYFFDHVRIEQMFFDGAVQAKDGNLQPDQSQPGFGLRLKQADTDRYKLQELSV